MSSISKKLHCICKTLGFGSCRCSMGSSHMYPATDKHVVAASWPLSTGNCPRVHCSSLRPWNTVSTDPAKGASVDCLIWPLHILTRVGDAFHTNQLDHDTDQTYLLHTEAEPWQQSGQRTGVSETGPRLSIRLITMNSSLWVGTFVLHPQYYSPFVRKKAIYSVTFWGLRTNWPFIVMWFCKWA